MPTAFLLMDSTYGTDDRCHDDSSELGSIAWLFLYTYVITCVCSTSAARSPPPCSAAAAVLVITHVLFIQLPHKYLSQTLSSQPGSLAPGHWPCQGRSRLLLYCMNNNVDKTHTHTHTAERTVRPANGGGAGARPCFVQTAGPPAF